MLMNLNNKIQLLFYDFCSYGVWSTDSRVAPPPSLPMYPDIQVFCDTLPSSLGGTYGLFPTNRIWQRWHDALDFLCIYYKRWWPVLLGDSLSFAEFEEASRHLWAVMWTRTCGQELRVASGSESPGNWGSQSGKRKGPEFCQQHWVRKLIPPQSRLRWDATWLTPWL